MSAYEAVLSTQRRLGYQFLSLGLPQDLIGLTGNAREGYRIKIRFRSEAEQALANLGEDYEGVRLDIKVNPERR